MIVLLLGPPGSGKGTQAKKLWIERKWPQLSTGDMLRVAIDQKSKLGLEAKGYMDKGTLVPDSLVIGLIEERSQAIDCENGFILDGFPRNMAQAQVLDKMLASQNRKLDRVALFKIADLGLIQRLTGRRTCIHCGAMYHIENAPPKRDDICDVCGKGLVQRDDDRAEVVSQRLKVYHQQTEPLVAYYQGQNKLVQLDAMQTAEDVANALKSALK